MMVPPVCETVPRQLDGGHNRGPRGFAPPWTDLMTHWHQLHEMTRAEPRSFVCRSQCCAASQVKVGRLRTWLRRVRLRSVSAVTRLIVIKSCSYIRSEE